MKEINLFILIQVFYNFLNDLKMTTSMAKFRLNEFVYNKNNILPSFIS